MNCRESKARGAEVRAAVRSAYAAIAAGRVAGCCGPKASCCGAGDTAALAREIGYAETELADLPEGANLGLSCGNPTALASLTSGEVVLDLGSGAGFDVFIAARKVGPEGRVIGVDMTPEMIARARANTARFRAQTGLDNVEFCRGLIEHLPVADTSVDVVISNCVLNLSSDKAQVWREMFRVLKPGGRVAVSDLALLQPLPKQVCASLEALIGCVAGAALIRDIERMARAAGFNAIRLVPRPRSVVEAMGLEAALAPALRAALPADHRLSDYVTSLDVTARKPC